MTEEYWKTIEQDLAKETSGGGTMGVYEDIVDIHGNIVVKGHRRTLARIHALNLGDVTGKTILDLGCNIGANLKYYSERGALCSGIEYNPAFCKWAEKLAPKACIYNNDLNITTAKEIFKEITPFNYVFCFSIWDYIDEDKLVYFIKSVSDKNTVLFFEGHADGEYRIDHSIQYQGKTLPSWKYVLSKLGVSNYRLVGMMENNTRPVFRCTF